MCQEKLREVQRSLLLTDQTKQLEESNRTHAEKSLQQLELRREKLIEEKEALPQPDDSELSRLRREVESTVVELKSKQDSLAQTEEQLLKTEEIKREITRETQTVEQQITKMEARSSALERLQHRLEDNEGLSEWLAKYKLDTLPRLWQNIQIDKGWEDALESVLRERLNSSSLERLEIVKDWIEDSPPGKWTLFESMASEGQQLINETLHSKEDWKSLEGYLTCENTGIKSVLKEWLRGIFVVESIQDGLLQRTKLAPGEMLVTREGHFFTQHSLTYYAPDSQLHGVLARQREITQIKTDAEGLGASLTKHKSKLVIVEEDCNKLGTLITQLRLDSEELLQQHHDLQMKVLKLAQLAEQSSQRGDQILVELTGIKQQIDVEDSQRQSSEKKLVEYQGQVLILQGQVKKEKEEEEVADQTLNNQRQLVQNVVKKMQEAEFYEKTCQNKIVEIENAIHGINESIAELRASLKKLESEQDGFDESALNSQLQEWLVLREQRELFLKTARSTLEDAAKELEEIEQERITSEHKLHPLRESISQARLKEQEAQIVEKQFDEKLKEAKLTKRNYFKYWEKRDPLKYSLILIYLILKLRVWVQLILLLWKS